MDILVTCKAGGRALIPKNAFGWPMLSVCESEGLLTLLFPFVGSQPQPTPYLLG